MSLLRHRSLKSSARDALVGYGEGVLDTLAYLLRDPGEDIWVRRHIPATIARIPTQKSVDILIEALQDPDSFLRYKAVTGLEKLHRDHPELTIDREPIEALAAKEALSYFNYLTLHYNLFDREKLSADGLLAAALREKMARAVDRVYRLLGLIYPWKDIGAARYAIEHGDTRLRASALEYVDNLLAPPLRKRLMLLVDDVPIDEKVRRANVVLKTRPRDAEETLLQLINDGDQIVAAAAIDLVEEREALDPGERHRVRARAPGREGLVRVRSRLLGTRSATASQRTDAAASGSSRCPWCSLRHACGACRCSRRYRSPSCSESPEAGARFGTRADASSIRKERFPSSFNSCSTAR